MQQDPTNGYDPLYHNTFINGRVFTIREMEHKIVKELSRDYTASKEYKQGMIAALNIIRGEKREV